MPFRDVEKKKAYNRKWRANNPDYNTVYLRRLRRDEPERMRRYQEKWSKANPDKVALIRRKAKKKYRSNPENAHKENVRNRLRYAVNKGKIIKPLACERCARKVPLEAHHEDYSKPFEVCWLCHRCHLGKY